MHHLGLLSIIFSSDRPIPASNLRDQRFLSCLPLANSSIPLDTGLDEVIGA
ncbi:hypothetical protein AVDCRST_MAG81-522 [uncultured Synechococcales cyanobacterium]|uniref:Uncharacterized protein n=1 Tax=uncultured Synechococcales cyanobacterium TaxID=1936017 RepID=A0A6J4UQ88_9CYAN|nr:hypothetical protein AVDCRST_MAG81-522 [uncultured Synechococcales cyanobacterium]